MKKVFFLFYPFISCVTQAQKALTNRATVQINYSPGNAANIFVPSHSLGAAFDGHGKGDIDRILTPDNINAMQQLHFGPLAYRLRTELGAETWHWNPHGRWSEPGREQGYWTSDQSSTGDIELCNGYKLPRRGNTHDQANDDGYSMADDGDTGTFWKSNPYLDSHFTNDPNYLHPQWIVVDLGRSFPVNAIRILWGNPFALAYKVDYATDIGKDYFDPLQPDLWHDLEKGNIVNERGENKTVMIADAPIKLRFIRVTMSETSGTTGGSSNDIRDKLGFAIREIEVGLLNQGKFHDYVRHAPDNEKQSVIHASSTDPWHRASDLDEETEQTGIDRFFTCGLTNNNPVLMPLAVLYSTPGDAAAMVQYIKRKKYNVSEYEMGEEPEGQLIDPHDYAALYCEWANAVRKIDTGLKLGGPGFASLATTPPDEYSFTEQKWTKIFLTYLKEHKRLTDFNFFSFEWYPFDDVCAPTAPQLAANPALLANALKELQKTILPPNTPIYITEYGYSSHSGKAQVDIEGALMYADILGKALTLGVNKAFLYGYEPTTLDVYNGCSWGNNMLFAMNSGGKIIYHTAAWYGMNMLTHFWAVPSDSLLELYPAECEAKNKEGQALITSYATRTMQNKWSVILINKDPKKAWSVSMSLYNSSTNKTSPLTFPLRLLQYSRKEYQWKANGSRGHPTRELPAINKLITANNPVILPPYSLTVVRED